MSEAVALPAEWFEPGAILPINRQTVDLLFTIVRSHHSNQARRSDQETFDDWLYKRYRSTPNKQREYYGTEITTLMREAYEAGKVIGHLTVVSDRNEGAK